VFRELFLDPEMGKTEFSERDLKQIEWIRNRFHPMPPSFTSVILDLEEGDTSATKEEGAKPSD
jgi:hypothetical protein